MVSWAKFDDGMPDHPKIQACSIPARWLWVESICYSSRFNLDGVIPASWDGLKRKQKLISELLEQGLWESRSAENPGSYIIHDYLDYQPSAEQFMELQEKKAQAGRRGGLAKALAGARGSATDSVVANGKQSPSRPVPSPSSEESILGTQSKPPTSSCSGGGEAEAAPHPSPAELHVSQSRAESLKAKMTAEVQKSRRVPWVFPETEIRHVRGLLQNGVPVDAILSAWRAYVGSMKDPAKISVFYFTGNFNRWAAEAARNREAKRD